jgi:hypothetical protein
MKKYLIVFILILAWTAYAQAGGISAGVHGVTISAGGGECTGYLICQNFETATTGYDNSESWSESAGSCTTFAHAYGTSPLRGTQSLYINDSSGHTCYTISPSFTASDEVWIGVRIAVGTPLDNFQILYLLDASDAVLLTVYFQTNGYVNTKHGTAATAYGTVTAHATNSTTYYVWIRWKKSTGTNGITEFYSGTARTSANRVQDTPASATNGNATTQAAKLKLYGYGAVPIKYDQVLIKTTDFGDFPN